MEGERRAAGEGGDARPAPGARSAGGFARVVAHRGGPLLVLAAPGAGGSAAIAARFVARSRSGARPERLALLARTRVAAEIARRRVERELASGHPELWLGTYEELAERLLRDYAVEAGLDPFFTTVGPADRLAIMLDRLDELPLRRHEIRGNPAGLLARLLRRIDLLKSELVSPERLRAWATGRERQAGGAAERERAKREVEFADLYARHDRILAESGSLDAGDLLPALGRLLSARADVLDDVRARFDELLVIELEDAAPAHTALLETIAGGGEGAPALVAAADPAQAIRRFRGAAGAPLAWFRQAFPGAAEVVLREPRRFGGAIARAADAVAQAIPDAVEAGDAAADEGGDGSVALWRCAGERAEAQAAAREAERLLAAGEVAPERIGIVVASGWRGVRLAAAALEERSVPFRVAGDAAFFGRPEVRDALAWMRMLADPSDAAAAVRALTRPPVELRSADLARVTTIARRRKLDMVAALEAALESPQLGPEARDRIQAFLKLQRAASLALARMPADVFVRRLVERVGMRRHRLFAATPEAAERLVNLSRLAELAADWTRRVPGGSARDFVRHIAAVAEAGEVGREDADPPRAGALVLAEPDQVKGLEFEVVLVLGLHAGAIRVPAWEDRWVPEELAAGPLPDAGEELLATRRARLAYVAITRARRRLVLSWPEESDREASAPAPAYAAVRSALGASEEPQDEELFGPAEGLHSTYRMIRDEVLEASWRAGSALSEMRLDTADDVNAAVARYLELVKLAALLQSPGQEPARETLAGLNELLGRIATPEQREILARSSLDHLVLGDEQGREARRELVAARREPSLEQFLPRRGDGLGLSASDIDLYRTCPLKYKFARVFAIPQEPTINQRFGILVHQVLERFHAEEIRARDGGGDLGGARPGSLERLLALFEAGWRRTGFGSSDDELQYRDRAVAALARYHERHRAGASRPVWIERGFSFQVGPHQLRGRVDRVDERADGAYELIDYKTGEQRAPARGGDDLQLALYRLAAREAWELEATLGSYWYVLADERVPVAAAPDDAERVERTVLEVAAGIEAQDFEPRPSYEICSWCDYRLICPASEA